MRNALVLMFAMVVTGNAFACPSTPCAEQAPTSRFELPSCTEWEMNTILIDALEHGDHSAAVLLRQRYRDTYTFSERNRIGVALIKATDDSEVWKELFARAEDAVRFAPVDGQDGNAELARWCAERGWDVRIYWQSLFESFQWISQDPRSLPLLRRALTSTNRDLFFDAVSGLALQRDSESLPLIAEALKKQKGSDYAAYALAFFRTAEADAVAMKYLNDETRPNYLLIREQQE
jgi:hypothetical protein